MHRMRGRIGLTIVAVALAIGATACTSDGGTGDKAGGPGEPVTLRMATVNGGLEFTPQIKYLLDRVAMSRSRWCTRSETSRPTRSRRS
jgi:hypothetical protein